jgi:hypothetical protein
MEFCVHFFFFSTIERGKLLCSLARKADFSNQRFIPKKRISNKENETINKSNQSNNNHSNQSFIPKKRISNKEDETINDGESPTEGGKRKRKKRQHELYIYIYMTEHMQ